MSNTVYGITKDKFMKGGGPVCAPLRGVGITWLMPGHGGCAYPDHRCAGDERCPFTQSRANPKTGLHSPLWAGNPAPAGWTGKLLLIAGAVALVIAGTWGWR